MIFKGTSVYSLITKTLGLIVMKLSDHTPYLTDDLGGDFKTYISRKDYPKIRELFLEGLDDESCNVFKILEQRFKECPNKSDVKLISGYSLKWLCKTNPLKKKLTSIESRIDLKRFFIRFGLFWKYPILDIEDSVFYYKHGLVFLPLMAQKYIRSADFYDIGTFQGDSILALKNYEFNQIHGFDISKISLTQCKNNLQKNGLDISKVFLNCVYVGANESDSYGIVDTGKSNQVPIGLQTGILEDYTVNKISIDSYYSNFKSNVKLIKADVEGALLDVIIGSKNVIEENRPILLLAIYHNPYEFFEVKNLIQSWNLNYTFMVRKLTHRIYRNAAHIETFLIAYPSELK